MNQQKMMHLLMTHSGLLTKMIVEHLVNAYDTKICKHVETSHGNPDNNLDVAELFPPYNQNLAETTLLDERLFNLKIWSRKIYFLMKKIHF